MDKGLPILLVLGDVQPKVGDERAVKILGFSFQLPAVGCCDGFLQAKERIKRIEGFAQKFDLFVGQQVVRFASWDNPMVREYKQ